MGYLFLLIALITGSIKGLCGKKTGVAVSELKDVMFVNLVRMLFCIIIGFLIICFQNDVSSLKISNGVMWLSLLSGIATSAFVVSWIMSVRKGAYMMIDVFLMLGTIIPMSVSSLLFDETVQTNQLIGFSLLVIAVIIMCSYNNSIKEKIRISSFLLLLLCGVANGVADLSQKLFVNNSEGYSNTVFNFYTYVFSAAVLLVCYVISSAKEKNSSESSPKKLWRVFGYILVMSLCLFLNSYFKTTAAIYLPASLLYPMAQGGGLILSSAMAAIFFKEKITVKCVIGITLSFVGLFVMNVL